MKIKPVGNYVLLKPKMIEKQSEGGIILPEELTQKEQMVENTGKIVAFGPTAFKRWKGCESPQWMEKACNRYSEVKEIDGSFEQLCDFYQWEDQEFPPWKQWGLDIGMTVEHRRYEAKDSVVKDDDGQIYRYIPDVEIIGVIEDE